MQLFFITLHILAVLFGFIFLVVTIPMHAFYNISKKKERHLAQIAGHEEKQITIKESNDAILNQLRVRGSLIPAWIFIFIPGGFFILFILFAMVTL